MFGSLMGAQAGYSPALAFPGRPPFSAENLPTPQFGQDADLPNFPGYGNRVRRGTGEYGWRMRQPTPGGLDADSLPAQKAADSSPILQALFASGL